MAIANALELRNPCARSAENFFLSHLFRFFFFSSELEPCMKQLHFFFFIFFVIFGVLLCSYYGKTDVTATSVRTRDPSVSGREENTMRCSVHLSPPTVHPHPPPLLPPLFTKLFFSYHRLTLQKGVSQPPFRQMRGEGGLLVIIYLFIVLSKKIPHRR